MGFPVRGNRLRVLLVLAVLAAGAGGVVGSGDIGRATGGADSASESPGSGASGDPAARAMPDSLRPLDALLAAVRLDLKSGDYDQATVDAKELIARSQDEPATLEQGYLLLIRNCVMRGNSYKNEPQGREPSELFYKEAERYVVECLSIAQLRHVKPSPAENPPEMVEMFRRVREESFGSIHLLRLDPADALVILEGDTLRLVAPDTVLALDDLPAGQHTLTLRRSGYRDLVDRITVKPGVVAEKSYTLSHRRGLAWVAQRAAVPVVGAAYLVFRKHTPERVPSPLDGPPALPGE